LRTTGSEGRRRATSRALAGAVLLLALYLAARYLWTVGFFDFLPWPAGVEDGEAGRPAGGEVQPCDDCHEEAARLHSRGPHHVLLCSECHGAFAGHVSGGERIAPMAKVRNVTRLCSRCHRRLREGRDEAPQINLEAHVVEVGALFSDGVCFDCHRPHDPRP